MRFCLFEDSLYANFLPLTYLRPIFDLRCGATTLAEKIRLHCSPGQFSFIVRGYLEECLREESASSEINLFPETDTWFINGRAIADEALAKALRKHRTGEVALWAENTILAARVTGNNIHKIAGDWTDKQSLPPHFDQLPQESIDCSVVKYPWDLISANSETISREFGLLAKGTRERIAGKIYPGAHLLNKKNILIGKGSVVKPGVIIDAEKGPVMIGEDVTIMPNVVIEGPVFVGRGSVLKIGAKIYHGTSIGEYCKVGGEVEASILQSYSNKQHEGFLGHSYLGSWVNLGADTNGSDLKNNYSTVKYPLNGSMVDTGQIFFGMVVGDHSKSGINSMFDTGSNIGIACNLFGSGLPPKFVPSFSWGGGSSFVVYELEKSIGTARRVMARRSVQMTAAYEKMYRRAFELSSGERSTPMK
jgi:UDP-N-acetylglucosamine diphosphorylase/glucosamine-1-phosphate N-acetyltransferase